MKLGLKTLMAGPREVKKLSRAAVQEMVEENPISEGLTLVVTMPAVLERLAQLPQAA